MPKSKKRQFKKLSYVEHVRLRTGMWLGQNSPSTYEQHFFQKQTENENNSYKIFHKEITDIPAKWKCLDEACMNAVDEFKRNQNDPKIKKNNKMNTLQVIVNNNLDHFKIIDNGRGIPAKNAENVFLHLMYGENFEDENNQEHIAGQNGVGISLVRIVSKHFKVITYSQNEIYQKTFTLDDKIINELYHIGYTEKESEAIQLYFTEYGNLKNCNIIKVNHKSKLNKLLKQKTCLASIKSNLQKIHGTIIEFSLDQKYFHNQSISFSEKLLTQYLQDLAMTNPGLRVVLEKENNKQEFLFSKGLENILEQTNEPYYKLTYKNSKNKFDLSCFIVKNSGKNLTWVNSNFTSLGGSAIEYLENRICDEVRKKKPIIAYEKKLRTTCTRTDVRNCFHMYTNLQILNPRFKSQDKSYLINDLNEDIRNAINESLDKLIRKLDLIENIKKEMEKRVHLKSLNTATKDLKKISRSTIPKFIPYTNKKKNDLTTLFIAEGDSAIAGLRPARNPNLHGLFPLRGKPLNVKNIPLAKAIQNEEIKNLIAILGLPINGKITSTKALNFDRVSIMTDADYDGYAIRSLIFNFFLEYWPELYNLNFIYLSSAPLYEVEFLDKQKKKKVQYCIDDNEYDKLTKKIETDHLTFIRKKRNKGLGETSKEAMKYAVNECLFQVKIENLPSAKATSNLWFHKDFVEDRKKAIAEYSQLFFTD